MSTIGSEYSSEAKNLKIIAQSTRAEKKSTTLKSDLLIFYLFWPIIFSPKELQFIFLLLIALFMMKNHKLYFDSLSYYLYSYIVLYAFSIILNVLTRSSHYLRVLAALNSLSIWIFAFVFYLIYRKIDIDKEMFKKIGFVNYSILILLWMLSMTIHSLTSSGSVTFLNKTLCYTETFNQEVVARFVGLMDYPNLIVMFCIFLYPLYFLYIRNFKSRILQVALLGLGLLPIFSSYSRSGYLIIGAAIALVIIFYLYSAINKNIFFFFSFFSLSILILLFYFSDLFNLVFLEIEELFSAREGSNTSREIIMAESISLTTTTSPFIGMGIKDISSAGYPLGSHSTFIGFFYKTGILGLLLGSWIFAYINLKILVIQNSIDRKIIGIFLFFMPIIFIVEDIDGANWLICMYFIFVAIIFNENNWKEKEKAILE